MNPRHEVYIPEFGNFRMRYYCQKTAEMFHPCTFPPHIHDELEIYVLLKGDVSFFVAGSLYKMQPYDAVIAKPNQVHNCVLNSDSEHVHLCFWFTPCSDFLFSDFLGAEDGALLRSSESDRAPLAALCDRFCGLPDEGSEPILEFSLGMELLSLLHRALRTRGAVSSVLPESLRRILAGIDADPGEIRTVSALCGRYYVSVSSLDRMFRKYLCTTPKAYMDSRRLAYSRILLSEGYSVTEACMRAGFPDCSGYIRLFRKRFGITPLQYQKRLADGSSFRSQAADTGG